MMIWLFAVYLDWLPAGKFLDPVIWLNAPDGINANLVFARMIWSAFIASIFIFVGLILSNQLPFQWRKISRWASVIIPLLGAVLYWQVGAAGINHFAWDILQHLILPVFTVTLIAYGGTMLLMRTSMLETLREDYILTARAKGIPDKMVRDKHAARNALLPVWTGLVFSIGNSVSGGIITETIFSWPGLGLTLLNSAQLEDIPLAMGALTITGVMTLVSHLVADVGYAFLDPRIRYD